MTQILAFSLLTGFTDVYNKNHHQKKAPGPRLFSAVLVQASRTNTVLTECQSDAIKSYCKFCGFQRTLSCHSCLKISVIGKMLGFDCYQ